MAKRKFIFQIGVYYHIYNRGIEKRSIFQDKGDLHHFLDSLIIMNNENLYSNREVQWRAKAKEKARKDNKPLVLIVAYALLPNHFHLILTPAVENGVSKFMQKIGTSHTRFFNEKYERSGSLFQGKFKAVQLEKERILELMSVYTNLNYKYHKISTKNIFKTSLFEYIKTEKGEIICDEKKVKEIVDSLGGIANYKKYLKRQSEYFANEKGFNVRDLAFDELKDL